MDKTDIVTIVAIGATAWAWCGAMFAKLSSLDVKVDMLTRSGRAASMDVILGGRRKTDPPMPEIAPIPTVLPVDRHD